LEPLLETPIFAVGHLTDINFGWFSSFPFGYVFLWFCNPIWPPSLRWLCSHCLHDPRLDQVGDGDRHSFHRRHHRLALIQDRHGDHLYGRDPDHLFALAVWARRSPSMLSWTADQIREPGDSCDQALCVPARGCHRRPFPDDAV
jgi:hypothetical protein